MEKLEADMSNMDIGKPPAQSILSIYGADEKEGEELEDQQPDSTPARDTDFAGAVGTLNLMADLTPEQRAQILERFGTEPPNHLSLLTC